LRVYKNHTPARQWFSIHANDFIFQLCDPAAQVAIILIHIAEFGKTQNMKVRKS
jgi:hypothetical protein